jgi:uracil-DNA glycosylase family 4
VAAIDDDQLERLVRQQAMTLRLMGVEFVPVYRARASVVAPSSASPPAGAPAEAVIEPKAVPGAAAATSWGAEGVAGSASSPGGRDRNAAQALLDRVREWYEQDSPHTNFKTDHTKIVFGVGDPCARLMFIGEAPGADEDRIGIPFVGRAGQMLDKWIAAMGLQRSEVYIGNVLKTRPPNNATPTIDEARLCAPYLYEQIAVVRPEVIVTLGLPATRLLLGTDQSMGQLRGRWSEFVYRARPGEPRIAGIDEFRVPVMPTYHPAFLLRSYTPENRGKVWADLQKAMERLGLRCNRSRQSA